VNLPDIHRELGELRGEFGELRGELGGLRAELHREVGLVRSDLAHQTRTMLLSLIELLIAGAGVAIGTAQLVG
jgi:ABC-type phosphate transport system auxiliary subunit